MSCLPVTIAVVFFILTVLVLMKVFYLSFIEAVLFITIVGGVYFAWEIKNAK